MSLIEVDPKDYQEEEKTTFDLALTHEEKMRLLFYLFLIFLGIGLLLGLFKSGEIVAQDKAVHALSNLTNETVMNLTGMR